VIHTTTALGAKCGGVLASLVVFGNSQNSARANVERTDRSLVVIFFVCLGAGLNDPVDSTTMVHHQISALLCAGGHFLSIQQQKKAIAE